MQTVKIVDARMGRGKTTAAINYVNSHKRDQRFMYVTPFLTEVARIRSACGLEEPVAEEGRTKMPELREAIRQGKGVVTTHSLYGDIDDEMLDVIREKNYVLIIDEAITAIDKAPITIQDKRILDMITRVSDDGLVSWKDSEYSGKFSEYKNMADKNTLYLMDGVLINTFNYDLFTAFSDVIVLTYLFSGSLLEAYFKCFGVDYEFWGVGTETAGSQTVSTLVPGRDKSPAIDYHPLINLVEDERMNCVGNPRSALSKNWYERHSYHDPEMMQLRNNMGNFFKNRTNSRRDNRLWTCFKDHKSKLIPDNNSYANNFLQISARATNEFAECYNIAYMANRFMDPNLLKFLSNHGCEVDQDICAMSDMLQWLWRSSIRNLKPINLYMPSARMRNLLHSWMDITAEGGVIIGELE